MGGSSSALKQKLNEKKKGANEVYTVDLDAEIGEGGRKEKESKREF